MTSVGKGSLTSAVLRPLRPNDCQKLADSLDETPETVIPLHLLKRRLCKAYVKGEPTSFAAAVVQSNNLRGEPFGLGIDHHSLWELLRHLDSWKVVDVLPAVAPRLGALIREATGRRVCYYGDIYHTMTQRPEPFRHESVRQLTLDDLPILQAAGENGASFGSLRALLTEGVVAGAVVSGKVVATALTSAITEAYADIGVGTDEAWRGHGFATAAASIVAERVWEGGRIPVWSCGEDNMASLRVAEKLGFEEVSRLTYVIRPSPA